jgi:hypothetical protein
VLVHLDARTHCLQFKRAVDDGGVTAAAVRAGLQVCVCVCRRAALIISATMLCVCRGACLCATVHPREH